MSQIFTVTNLNERIKERLENDPRLHDLWAQGEVSNFVHHRSGHMYFTLKDRDSQISCVLFKGQAGRVETELRNGMNVLLFGDVAVYRPQGRVQLVARAIKRDSGLGFRFLQFEALKKRLEEEGLFELEQKRPLPPYPERIGVVTSLQGAALRDVLRSIGPYPARIIISPAQVQGEGAEESIVSALLALQGRTDLIIVCRGGGSAEDLWCFNSEVVARAVYACDSPVISAVGHETDVTITDFAADVRAATPTAAAKMAVPDVEELRIRLRQSRVRIIRALWSCLERKEERLEYLQRSLSAARMYSLTGDFRQRLDHLSDRLDFALAEELRDRRARLDAVCGRLAAVGPRATLQRGYALARSERGLVMAWDDVRPGEEIELILGRGGLRCRVLDCIEEKESGE
ncbi:exodeoxyribonuclease VII large subunit [Methanothrix sp.]|uniref:exodeoxyribonuclease VII large subunit n=4 Tax=Methanothrix sp. TaxID=90426 RepID=UPI001BD5BC09